MHKVAESGLWVPTPAQDMGGPNTLILYFGDPDLGRAARELSALRQAYPGASVLGCSTAGAIQGDEIVDGGVAAVVAFDRVRVRTASVELPDPRDSRACGRRLGALLRAPDLKAVLVFSEGVHVNGSRLVQGIREGCPPDVAIAGGLAGDADRFQDTWVCIGDRCAGRTVAAAGLYGDAVGFACGSRGGWDVLGPVREVTRARENVLFELDGQPALEVYKRYLGERAAGLPATGLLFPLAILPEPPGREPTVRTLLAIDEAEHAMTLAGNVPEGARVQLMYANFDRVIDAAGRAAESAGLDDVTMPALCVAISCVGRRLVLGGRAEEELEVLGEALPPGVARIGFYSYGEISADGARRCALHNQTMTLSLLWERGTS